MEQDYHSHEAVSGQIQICALLMLRFRDHTLGAVFGIEHDISMCSESLLGPEISFEDLG